MEARELVQRILADHSVPDVSVTSRAKDTKSALEKVRRKNYGAPWAQLTDAVGVRVISFYRDGVDRAADVLRSELEIDSRRSPDKRENLALREFGYRSVHLLARQRTLKLSSPLGDRWFEIQIRSLLEHAWAEIEHEVVYKSGTVFPRDVRREFSALAGTLELLDREFLRLRSEAAALVGAYREAYERGEGFDELLDAARLAGLLEYLRPDGLSSRRAAEELKPFPRGLESSLVEAARTCGVATASDFARVMTSPRFRGKLGAFAASQGLAASEISHIAIAAMVVWTKCPDLLESDFPDLATLIPHNAKVSSAWLAVGISS